MSGTWSTMPALGRRRGCPSRHIAAGRGPFLWSLDTPEHTRHVSRLQPGRQYQGFPRRYRRRRDVRPRMCRWSRPRRHTLGHLRNRGAYFSYLHIESHLTIHKSSPSLTRSAPAWGLVCRVCRTRTSYSRHGCIAGPNALRALQGLGVLDSVLSRTDEAQRIARRMLFISGLGEHKEVYDYENSVRLILILSQFPLQHMVA